MLFLGAHWRKPMDYSDETLARRGRGLTASARCFATPPSRGEAPGTTSSEALEDDFNTPEALAVHARLARPRAPASRRSTSSGSASLAEETAAPDELHALARQRARGARRAATSTKPTACARRSRTPAGRCATSPANRATSSSRSDDRGGGARLRPPAGARGAPRPARGTGALGDRAGLSGRAMAPGGRSGARHQAKAERELTEEAGTRDHQGVLAFCEPYRYADAFELAAEPSPLLVCLDRVTDPHNLGAVCRAAEGAGATGVDRPGARVGPRHAGGLPRLGGGGRARPARGRAEPRPLSGRGQGRGSLGLRRRCG